MWLFLVLGAGAMFALSSRSQSGGKTLIVKGGLGKPSVVPHDVMQAVHVALTSETSKAKLLDFSTSLLPHYVELSREVKAKALTLS